MSKRDLLPLLGYGAPRSPLCSDEVPPAPKEPVPCGEVITPKMVLLLNGEQVHELVNGRLDPAAEVYEYDSPSLQLRLATMIQARINGGPAPRYARHHNRKHRIKRNLNR